MAEVKDHSLADKSDNQTGWRFPWRSFWAEFVGTGLLLLGGLSLVIFMFGEGSIFSRIVPSLDLRRAINGFLFGSIGSAIALSPVGKESGAHMNPVVSLVFWLAGKLDLRDAAAYILAQLAGATVGCLPLLAWGSMGRSISFGATTPGKDYSMLAALMGEVVTTFGLVAGLCVFLAFRNLRGFTPAMIPFFYAFIVPLEAPISGTSTNPARSLGPAIISGEWHGWWIYWIGPVIGAFIAVFASSRLAKRIEVAKLYYFETDRRGAIHKLTGRA
jgi:aquaporin Z